MKKINLGSGKDYREGYINLDENKIEKADKYHNLNKTPYPFEDNEIDEILANHIMEHLDDPFTIMAELHRILKNDGKLTIRVPHFSRALTHSQHKAGFDVTFPHYFDKNFTRSGYFGVDFELEKMELHWMAFFDMLKYMKINPLIVSIFKVLNKMINFLANLSPKACSRIWCFWVGGFEEIEFVFKAKK